MLPPIGLQMRILIDKQQQANEHRRMQAAAPLVPGTNARRHTISLMFRVKPAAICGHAGCLKCSASEVSLFLQAFSVATIQRCAFVENQREPARCCRPTKRTTSLVGMAIGHSMRCLLTMIALHGRFSGNISKTLVQHALASES